MLDQVTLKLIHQSCVFLSIVGFVSRGGLMLAGSELLYRRWMRTWPHLIDTLLLISGLWMALNLHLYPGNSPWLGAKLLALVAYIALGFVALRKGKTRRIRIIALALAVACLGYIVLVAVTRSVLPY